MVLVKILLVLYSPICTEKKAKITKQSHAYRGHKSYYNIYILNSFNPELQIKDTESAIRNKLIDLLTGFKFEITSVTEFKKIKSDYAKQNIPAFIFVQKQK